MQANQKLVLDLRTSVIPVQEYTLHNARKIAAWFLQDAHSTEEFITWSGDSSSGEQSLARFLSRADAVEFVAHHPALQMYQSVAQ